MEVKDLEAMICYHRDLYYNNPDLVTLSDAEFDALIDTLKQLDPNSSVLKQVGAPPEVENKKIKHDYSMTSLDKAVSIFEFEHWLQLNDSFLEKKGLKEKIKEVVLTLKLDGVSVDLKYENGAFIQAVTRGDGFEGEDITNHVQKMKNFFHKIPILGSIHLRGEMILFKEDYTKHFPEMKNARNAVSGLTKRLDFKGCEFISILYFGLIQPNLEFKQEMGKLEFLKESGLATVPAWVIPIEKFAKVAPEFALKRAGLPYEIDGLVLKVNDLDLANALDEERIVKGHNPKSQIAYKFESEKRISKLIDIYWSPGARGHITPVAILEPISFSGVTVQKASLANVSEIQRLDIAIGDEVLVERANDVIPKVLKVVQRGSNRHLNLPDKCPTCGSALDFDGKFLSCLNQGCSDKTSGSIRTWIVNLGIKDFGEKLIDQLVEKNLIHTISDLYFLKATDIVLSIERFGEKSAVKALKNLHSRKEMSLSLFLGSLGIRDCSQATFSILTDQGFNSLEKILNASVSDLQNLKGIGEKTALSVVEGLQNLKEEIVKLSKVITIVVSEKTSGPLSGLTFQVTGELLIPRKEWIALVEKNGGQVKPVSKDLKYLVTEDDSSGSSKLQKAAQLGVQIISFEQFLGMLK